MKKNIFSFLFFFIIIISSCKKNETPDPCNQYQKPYSFFVAGHTYGKPGVDNIGFHPPFKEKFNFIQNYKDLKFGVLTGDIVPLGTKKNWDEIDEDIISLNKKVYFAVGNHDMTNRELFESRYGKTYFYFLRENDLFIVLDPNIDNWNISGPQLNFLTTTINEYNNVRNIFVFFHQLLWREKDNKYTNVKPNSTEGRDENINFWTEIEPMFHELPNQVYMFAGDLGAASWSSDFMYDTYDNITFVASGMGEGKGDNFIIVNVAECGDISFDLISLNTEDIHALGNLEDYILP